MKTPLQQVSLRAASRVVTLCAALAILIGVSFSASPLSAQQLGWEGSSGVFVTPLAYTAASPERRLSRPVVAYHYLNGGDVLGTFSQISITEGFAKRIEFGYTRTIHAEGNNPTFSPLWTDGFNTFHGKGALIGENAWKQPWMPQVAAGFTVRSQVKNVGGALNNKDTVNGDVYLAASKTIKQLKLFPVIVTGGVRGSNAELFGLAGNATEWGALGFGSVAFLVHGPAKTTIVLAAEVSQQPHHPEGLATATIPTTMVYAVRVLPSPKLKLNVDFGMLQGPGRVAPGVNLEARARPAFAVSYAF